ncbi:MAG: hypothetical protein QXJ18_05340 [Desulfurococcaceae archaeon]
MVTLFSYLDYVEFMLLRKATLIPGSNIPATAVHYLLLHEHVQEEWYC